jgi:hypothetical protein
MRASRLLFAVAIIVLLAVAYFAVVLNWNYSSGERAGWVQKLSKKGWLCKTWEGELSLVSMPGAVFTVHDNAVAEQINKVMGKRVSLHYEEKVGLPTSCFGDTRAFVTGVRLQDEISLMPGVIVPMPPASVPASAASR